MSARGGASRTSTDAEAPPRADTQRRAWVGPLLREAQAPTQPRYGLSSGVATSSSSAWCSGVGPERRAGPFAARRSAGPARRSETYREGMWASRECGRERSQAGMPVSPVGLRGALGHAERVAVAARSSGGSVRVSARGGASRTSTDAEAPPRADTQRRAWVGPSLREAQAPTQPRYGLSSGVATSSSSAWCSGVGPERRAGPFAARRSAGPARRSGPTGKACDALAGVR